MAAANAPRHRLAPSERTSATCDAFNATSACRAIMPAFTPAAALDGAHEVLRVADAALYELSEDAFLSTDEEGRFPVFDPAGAVAYGIQMSGT